MRKVKWFQVLLFNSNNLTLVILQRISKQETQFFFFIIQRVKAPYDTLPSSAANQGDNTVSVAQGGTATPGITKQLLPPGRVFKRNIYMYIHGRSTKSRDYIRRLFIFNFSAVCDLKTHLISAIDVIATVSWCCVITWEWWFHVCFIHVEIPSISVVYSVCFPSVLSFFMRYCTKALQTNII